MSGKTINSQLEKRASIIEKLEKDIYSLTDNSLYCKICDKKIKTIRLFTIRRHENSSIHKTLLNRFKLDTSSHDFEQSTFTKDLCSAMIAADIPFNKLQNKEFREFLEKYTKKKFPTRARFEKIIYNHAIMIQ